MTTPLHAGRQELPAPLPRREKILVCPPEQCTCQVCGRETTVIGYEQSEQLEGEPARSFVLVTKREKRACRLCSQQGVTAAPLPLRVLDKSLVVWLRNIVGIRSGRPLLAAIKPQREAAPAQALPASALGKATRYTLALWPKRTRFLPYPELEFTNNLAENSMRPIALGRKNWIHVGSPQAGPKVAAILSIVESCRRLQIPVRDYLANVLPGLAHRSVQHLKNRTPSAWAARP